jgi:transposase
LRHRTGSDRYPVSELRGDQCPSTHARSAFGVPPSVISAVEAGSSRRAAAERFGIGIANAIRWVRAFKATGTTRAQPKGGDQRSHRIEAYRDVILDAVSAQVDITLIESADMLRQEHGLHVAPSTVWRFLDRHSMTVKKTAHASEQDRPDVVARRQAWFDAQPKLDPQRLVYR